MLLTLIKTRKTRYGWRADLIETNHVFGDRHLATVHVAYADLPLELFYPVTIPQSGICLQGKPTNWRWGDRKTRKTVETYLRSVQATREEIRLEVKKKRPKYCDDIFFAR